MVYSVFGYGSLIRPSALVNTFPDHTAADDSYAAGRQYGDKDLVSPETRTRWQEIREDITIIPAKLSGFRRTYCIPSSRGGTMLGLLRTGDEQDMVNGIVYTGLTDTQFDHVKENEQQYTRIQIDGQSFIRYPEAEDFRNQPVSLPQTVHTFVTDTVEQHEPRNETYHGRILVGIEDLGEQFGSQFAQLFLRDFLATTYEHGDPLLDSIDPGQLPYNLPDRN